MTKEEFVDLYIKMTDILDDAYDDFFVNEDFIEHEEYLY